MLLLLLSLIHRVLKTYLLFLSTIRLQHRTTYPKLTTLLKGLSQVPQTLKSLNLCYLGLYRRKSILSFSNLHLKEIYTK